jgi:hypothetical protein
MLCPDLTNFRDQAQSRQRIDLFMGLQLLHWFRSEFTIIVAPKTSVTFDPAWRFGIGMRSAASATFQFVQVPD